jgi:hypothetical protein
MNSFANTHKRSMRSSGHDTENAAERIAYTQTNESADPEQNAMPKVEREYSCCSRLLAVFKDTSHSRNIMRKAISPIYISPMSLAIGSSILGSMIMSNTKPPKKRIVVA